MNDLVFFSDVRSLGVPLTRALCFFNVVNKLIFFNWIVVAVEPHYGWLNYTSVFYNSRPETYSSTQTARH